jgi:hypothetical protein
MVKSSLRLGDPEARIIDFFIDDLSLHHFYIKATVSRSVKFTKIHVLPNPENELSL